MWPRITFLVIVGGFVLIWSVARTIPATDTLDNLVPEMAGAVAAILGVDFLILLRDRRRDRKLAKLAETKLRLAVKATLSSWNYPILSSIITPPADGSPLHSGECLRQFADNFRPFDTALAVPKQDWMAYLGHSLLEQRRKTEEVISVYLAAMDADLVEQTNMVFSHSFPHGYEFTIDARRHGLVGPSTKFPINLESASEYFSLLIQLGRRLGCFRVIKNAAAGTSDELYFSANKHESFLRTYNSSFWKR